MTSILYPTNPVSFLFLLLIVAMVAVAVAPIAANIPALQDIPWTNHALRDHGDREWNASTVSARLSSRSCHPIEAYACSSRTVVMCPVGDPDDLWIGLFIGTAPGNDGPAVVTGYAAPRSYWEQRVSGCLPVEYVP